LLGAQRETVQAPARRRGRPQPVEHLSREERVARGKQARQDYPLEAHAYLAMTDDRDPVGLLLDQAQSRVPELVPVRHGRMLVSPFTFYRGAALPMAADLAAGPSTSLIAQLCGDAHLSNFGAFASPERRMVFDVNDFDETLPGPFEWDVKRLAASLVVAGIENGFTRKDRRRAVLDAAMSYRDAMRDFATRPLLDVWYAHLDIEQALVDYGAELKPKRTKQMQAALAKAHTHDSMQALSKLTQMVDGRRQITATPPTIVPVEDLAGDVETDAIYGVINDVVAKYRRTLQSDRRALLERFSVIQVARKVVGVGSVGTQAFIVLMDAQDGNEPLFLQAKQAEASVLARYVGASPYDNHGERVVAGQHLMQAESDIFLGWTRSTGPYGAAGDYYIRQLRDWKFSLAIEQVRPPGMAAYARMCGWTLARGHARSGDRIAIAAYLGGSRRFDNAIADFAETYAEQNERDYSAFQEAVQQGRAEAMSGI
jgi:uncharacterized protein (DUF2252 family)